MTRFTLKNWLKVAVILSGILLLGMTDIAFASTTGNLPFNTAMDTFKTNFIAWLFVAAVVLWIATCLMLAFGEWGEGMKRIINIVFWLSLALSGTTGVTALFGSGAIC